MPSVLSVASEAYPLIKTGGLADVAGALPAALAREGFAARTLLPGYPAVLRRLEGGEVAAELTDLFGGPARLLSGRAGALDVLAIEAPHLYGREGNPYAGPEGDWPDNAQRFAALGRVAERLARGLLPAFTPDIVHAHDWQAGLAPAYLHYGEGRRPGTVMTVHNLAFQGQFPGALLTALDLPPHAWSVEGVEYYGALGFLKAGLRLADRVTTVSIHQHPGSIYPHTGYPTEIGSGAGRGHSVNLALPEGVTDSGWLRAVDAVVEPVLRELRPFALVTQHGCDTHAADPLGGLHVSIEAQRAAAAMMGALADEHAGGRWLALGGGGYDLAVVPRAWAHVAAVVAGIGLDPATPTPPGWRAHFLRVVGREAPSAMGDGVTAAFRPFHAGHDPADAVDRAIMAARNAAFPCLGLDPLTA